MFWAWTPSTVTSESPLESFMTFEPALVLPDLIHSVPILLKYPLEVTTTISVVSEWITDNPST